MKLPEPVIDAHGVPTCTEACGRHDGKRCELLGHRPSSLCEPAVRTLATELKTERSLLLDLLAVVHRDGGHHTGRVGLAESARDAMAKVTEYLARESERG